MFERFTDRARRVIVLAQDEAKLLNHNYIGTEHLLLGLIHEGEGVAAKALEQMGISLQAAREQVVEIMGQGQQVPSGHIPFSPHISEIEKVSIRKVLTVLAKSDYSIVPKKKHYNNIEVDEFWTYVQKKENKQWLIYAYDRETGEIIAYV